MIDKNYKSSPDNPFTYEHAVSELHKALKKFQEDNNKSIFDEFIKQSILEPSVMIALMRKIVPDLEKMTLDGSVTTKNIDLDDLDIVKLKDMIKGK